MAKEVQNKKRTPPTAAEGQEALRVIKLSESFMKAKEKLATESATLIKHVIRSTNKNYANYDLANLGAIVDEIVGYKNEMVAAERRIRNRP